MSCSRRRPPDHRAGARGRAPYPPRNWRDALKEALGPNGQLIVDLVPELKLIIGEQPSVPDLSPQDAQRRFQLVFRRFIGSFARPDHPHSLFQDALQRLDTANLQFLEEVFKQSAVPYFMMIRYFHSHG